MRLDQREEIELALVAASSLLKPIGRFFEEVLVMADDTAVRANRLALLQDIAATLRRFGNLEVIVK